MSEYGIFLIIVGILINFSGWVLYRISLKVSGVLAGVIVGIIISIFIVTAYPGLQKYSFVVFPVSLILFGFIGQAFFKRLNMIVMFVLGSSMAIIVGGRFLGPLFFKVVDKFVNTDSNAFELLILNIILGFTGGIVAVALQKYIFILVTSVIGTLCIHNGFEFKEDNLIAFSLILILGIATQTGLFRWLDKKYKVEEE